MSEIKNTYSNVIFFGDSQSDIGNVPTTSICREEIEYRLVTALCYVPISNPVDSKTSKTYQLPGTIDEKYRFNYPDVNHFAQFTNGVPLINGYERESSSLGWTHYFVSNASNTGLISENNLYTWTFLKEFGLKNKLSNVNYSWVSALSDQHCYRLDFWNDPTPFTKSKSNSDQIFKRQNSFRENPKAFGKMVEIVVPASSKQVELFKEDLKNNSIEVNDKTLYLIWTGANDVSLAFTQTFFIKHFLKNNIFKAVMNSIPHKIASTCNNSLISTLINSGANPKHIAIVSQYNVGMIPAMMIKFKLTKYWQKKLFTFTIGTLINIFNRRLKRKTAILQAKYPDITFEFIDIKNVFDKLTKKGGPFYEKFGIGYIHENMNKVKNGGAVDAEGYMYWDGLHFASPAQQVVANEVLSHLAGESVSR